MSLAPLSQPLMIDPSSKKFGGPTVTLAQNGHTNGHAVAQDKPAQLNTLTDSSPTTSSTAPAAPAPEPTPEPAYKYTHLLPTFDQTEHYPPLEPFTHVDPGFRALSRPDPLEFLREAKSVVKMSPNLGTEIDGVDLRTLGPRGRDQVALEVAKRGVLVFRNQQSFIDAGPEFYKEWGSYFGRLHVHPTSGHPKDIPELHLVYRDEKTTFNFEREERTSSTLWHSDVSYELQPPGLTTFFLVSQPSTGGDTLFASQSLTLSHLSPPFISFLRTLKAVHSGVEQANYSRGGKRGGVVRREPVEHVHPVVRRHPVTGREALYVNQQFTRRVKGLRREESDAILNFLYDHVAKAGDAQIRVKWEPYTVVLWDNRVTAHSANGDYAHAEVEGRRHGVRITPQAERPVPALEGLQLD